MSDWKKRMRVVAIAAVQLGFMLGGSIVIETVFAWPGIGRLLYEGISSRDFPVVQAVVLLGGMILARWPASRSRRPCTRPRWRACRTRRKPR